jgi:hypothetical protein
MFFLFDFDFDFDFEVEIQIIIWRAPVRFAACPTQPFNAVGMLKSKTAHVTAGFQPAATKPCTP